MPESVVIADLSLLFRPNPENKYYVQKWDDRSVAAVNNSISESIGKRVQLGTILQNGLIWMFPTEKKFNSFSQVMGQDGSNLYSIFVTLDDNHAKNARESFDKQVAAQQAVSPTASSQASSSQASSSQTSSSQASSSQGSSSYTPSQEAVSPTLGSQKTLPVYVSSQKPLPVYVPSNQASSSYPSFQ